MQSLRLGSNPVRRGSSVEKKKNITELYRSSFVQKNRKLNT